MNLIATSPTWLVVLLGLLLAAAAIEDVVRLRISNLTCVGVIIAALVAMALAGFPPRLWQNAAIFAVLLAVGLFLFAAAKVGGGDVKLLAALGLWVDFGGAVGLLVTVFLAGGVLALVIILLRYVQGRRVARKTGRGAGIPYGVAIVAGAAIVFGSQLGLTQSKPAKSDPFAVRPLG